MSPLQLDLQPGTATLARFVATIESFGDHALHFVLTARLQHRIACADGTGWRHPVLPGQRQLLERFSSLGYAARSSDRPSRYGRSNATKATAMLGSGRLARPPSSPALR